jgi:hypothetical protein
MKKAILTILTGAALAVGSAQAAIVFGNLGADGDGAIATSGGQTVTRTAWSAVGFKPDGVNLLLNSATLGLFTLPTSGSTTAKLSLYSGDSAPSVNLFSTSQTLPQNTLNQPITFTLNQALTAGSTYWLVLERASGNNLTWRPTEGSPVLPTEQNSSGWANLAASTYLRTANSGTAWNETTSRFSISLDASPIPEPGTWAAMAIFAGGAAYAGWRRRQQPQMA